MTIHRRKYRISKASSRNNDWLGVGMSIDGIAGFSDLPGIDAEFVICNWQS